ncbi:acyl-ACP--UDP-N-acetylglucosamine O-acyltransferase [Kutzneria sp. CA-103260]|uniref:acyl-ACP--UDP-N-acetylglucosamine O-acyltransferase n=1 Tax=Kutzneria sp. CA-103260 TaxID=2802641 RepID=UPI001BAA7EE6|nr:acyl-ACP--UDP-N-acetylglucosamine O-acyltransferase [Kutzneria sp. CA-103260]QUQ66461.1 Acyl-[acyl-carrier-protein]--UDP-N-acetylglucosamine O-acyltransferase [Kutzneria sp. CA-103260]
MVQVHPSAVVAPEAELADDVVIGPYAVVHGCVRLAAGVRVDAHAVLGGDPQDLAFAGGPTGVEIGPDTVIREAAIVHRATTSVPTRIGAGCLIMGQVHVAHDCQLGDGVIVSQATSLGGHVVIDDRAVVGGMCGVHQHVRIGRQAMVGAMSKVTRDVLPFCGVDGIPATHRALNVVGLRRSGMPPAEYNQLRLVFDRLRDGHELESWTDGPVAQLVEFLAGPSRRGISPFRQVRREA